MRHGKKDNHLSRTHSHREAMLQNMAASLILHKRIETTVAKAKELRKFVEPLLTKAKDDTFQNRRVVFQSLHNKETMKELFGAVADKIAGRPGGYTRIIKLGNRAGDNAETCLIELVDFNETLLAAAAEKASATTTTRTRRSRRGGSSRPGADAATETTVATQTPVTSVTKEDQTDQAPVIFAESTGDTTEDTTVTETPGAPVAAPVTDSTKDDQTDQSPTVFGESDDETKQS